MDFPLGPTERDRLRILRASGLLSDRTVPGLDELCEEARDRFQVTTALVTLLDADQQIFKAKRGIEASSTPRSQAFCNYTILSDAVFTVPDAANDPRFSDNGLVTGPPFIRFYAGAPLLFEEDIRLGALCLIDPRPRNLAAGEKAELLELAERAVSLIVRQWFELDRAR